MGKTSKYQYGYLTLFILFHFSLLGIIVTGVSWWALSLAAGLYLVRMWGVTAGYHRYFSHKGFKTGRVFQFVLAFIAQSSAQQGILWWANHHRHHHLTSDSEDDFHSPRQKGFWHSHVGWIFTPELNDKSYTRVGDFQKYPELVWLDKHRYLPAVLLAAAVFLLTGLQGLVVGFCLSTILLYHATFGINSLTHVYGRQRYHTGDDSRNSFLFSLLTLGEGWHNNHHYHSACARQGFRWWQIDITYYVLKVLSWFGLVWELKQPHASVLEADKTPSPRIVRRINALIDQAGFRFHAINLKLNRVKETFHHAPTAYFNDYHKALRKDLYRMDLMLRCQKRYLKRLPPKLAKETRYKITAMRSELKSLKKQTSASSKQACLESLEKIQQYLHSIKFPQKTA